MINKEIIETFDKYLKTVEKMKDSEDYHDVQNFGEMYGDLMEEAGVTFYEAIKQIVKEFTEKQ